MRARDWFENLDRARAGELPAAELAEFERELSGNPEAHREYARINAELDQLGRAEPPEQALPSRQQIVGRALELAREPRSARRSPVLRWAPVALFPVAAAAAGLFVWSLREIKEPAAVSSPAAELVLQSGSVEAGGKSLQRGARIAPSTELKVAGEQAELALWDASLLRASRDTTIAYTAKPEDRLVLFLGELSLKVKPREKARPLVVQTAEADTWVVGTEFVVRRAPRGTAFVTTVVVTEGTVKVVGRPAGETRLLSAGQEATFGAPLAAASDPAQGSESPERIAAAVPEKDRDTGSSRGSEARQTTTAKIREKLRQGSIGTARQLIQQARAQGASEAELSVLEAEADLAERRYSSARQRYLRIVETYPNSPQAELSLFAAAQLSHGSSSIDLLQRYLARYPNGRFSREAHRLLDTLDARRSDR